MKKQLNNLKKNFNAEYHIMDHKPEVTDSVLLNLQLKDKHVNPKRTKVGSKFRPDIITKKMRIPEEPRKTLNTVSSANESNMASPVKSVNMRRSPDAA